MAIDELKMAVCPGKCSFNVMPPPELPTWDGEDLLGFVTAQHCLQQDLSQRRVACVGIPVPGNEISNSTPLSTPASFLQQQGTAHQHTCDMYDMYADQAVPRCVTNYSGSVMPPWWFLQVSTTTKAKKTPEALVTCSS
jgi:hypothetical protein